MANALIALGGNIGDVRTTFASAIARILDTAQATLLARSSDYSTPPWGDSEQNRFINACIAIETALDPHALLRELQNIETQCGRERRKDRRWGPRTLDLDLLAYDDARLDMPDLTLPHPRLFERAFVLVPLTEIVPERIIAGRTPREALSQLSTEGIEKLSSP